MKAIDVSAINFADFFFQTRLFCPFFLFLLIYTVLSGHMLLLINSPQSKCGSTQISILSKFATTHSNSPAANHHKEFFFLFEFFTLAKSDRSLKSDRNKMQFLRIITI